MAFGIMTLSDLKPIWRVVVGIIICQILGGAMGLLIGAHHSGFSNFWLGGAIGSPVGFILGIGWHLLTAEGRAKTPLGTTLFLGVLAFALGAAACFQVLPHMRGEMQRLRAIKALDASKISSVSVFDRYGESRIAEFSSPSTIREFALSCRDAEGYSPNHPHYVASWYIVIAGTDPSEIECHYEAGRGQMVVGYFVAKSGTTTRYYGTFSSRNLRKWFEKHLRESAN